MTDIYVTYAPGDWTLLARAGRYLLVDAKPTDPPISRLWDALSGDAVDGVLAALNADSLGSKFCLIRVGEDGVHLAQAGIAATLDGGAVSAGPMPTDVPVPASGWRLVASVAQGPSGFQIPIEGGVVGAEALTLVQVPAEGSVEVAEVEPVAAIAEPATEPEPEPEVGSRANTQIWADVPEFDETAAIGAAVEVAAPIGLADSPLSGLSASDELPADVPADELIAAESALRFLDAPPPQPRTEDCAPGTSGSLGETVLAAICLDGHYSGGYSTSCRVCGTPMPQQTPRTIPRPSLGFLVLQSGERVELDRGAVLGRAPRVPDEATEQPHLVSLASYGRDVSRQHVEIIVHGWNVFVKDLGSANGTRLQAPIGQITTLEPGVAIPLAPETVIHVADVTTIKYRTA